MPSKFNNPGLKKSSEDNPKSMKHSKWFSHHHGRLFRAILIVWLLAIAGGFVNGYSSPAVENINAQRNPFHLLTAEKAWVGSVMGIGILFGGLISGVFVDFFGRQCTLMLTLPLFTIGWVTIAASTNLTAMIIGRIITSYGGGAFLIVIPIYLSEIVPCSIRGMVLASLNMAINVGLVLAYACGSVVPWNWLAIIGAGILTLAMLYLPFLPETPHWLLMKGYKDASLQSLVWLRGHEDVNDELSEIAANLQQVESAKPGIWEITNRRIYKPLLISVGLWLVQVFSGIDFVMFYTVTIFAATGNGIDPYFQTILFGLLCVLGNFVAVITLDKLGRRFSLLVSTVLAAISMPALGTYFKMKNGNTLFATNELFWLPLTSLLFFVVSYSFGLGPVPSAMTAELLPARARGIGGSIAIVVMSFFMFLEARFSLPLTETWIQTYGAFWGFSLILVIGAIFIFFCVPETKGKTLEAIDEMFT